MVLLTLMVWPTAASPARYLSFVTDDGKIGNTTFVRSTLAVIHTQHDRLLLFLMSR